jgi:hypothetical protein
VSYTSDTGRKITDSNPSAEALADTRLPQKFIDIMQDASIYKTGVQVRGELDPIPSRDALPLKFKRIPPDWRHDLQRGEC